MDQLQPAEPHQRPRRFDGSSSGFWYTHDRQLRKQMANFAGTLETTHYIGGILEKVILGGVESWRHHIIAGDGEVAIYTRKSSGTNEVHYLSKDHLGSTDVITNASGAVEVRMAFGAFGQRRNAAGWSGNPTAADWSSRNCHRDRSVVQLRRSQTYYNSRGLLYPRMHRASPTSVARTPSITRSSISTTWIGSADRTRGQ